MRAGERQMAESDSGPMVARTVKEERKSRRPDQPATAGRSPAAGSHSRRSSVAAGRGVASGLPRQRWIPKFLWERCN